MDLNRMLGHAGEAVADGSCAAATETEGNLVNTTSRQSTNPE
jgi:hypothetical protein